MKYDPKTAEAHLLEDGVYDATLEAEDKLSRNQQPMLVITATIYKDGLPRYVFDYISEHYIPICRLEELCDVLNLDFNGGEVKASQISGHGVRVKIATQKAKDGYEPKNVIRQYLSVGAPPISPEVTTGVPSGDDIPF